MTAVPREYLVAYAASNLVALALLAISPLGVGSAFPFSVIYIAAMVVMEQRLERPHADVVRPRTA